MRHQKCTANLLLSTYLSFSSYNYDKFYYILLILLLVLLFLLLSFHVQQYCLLATGPLLNVWAILEWNHPFYFFPSTSKIPFLILGFTPDCKISFLILGILAIPLNFKMLFLILRFSFPLPHDSFSAQRCLTQYSMSFFRYVVRFIFHQTSYVNKYSYLPWEYPQTLSLIFLLVGFFILIFRSKSLSSHLHFSNSPEYLTVSLRLR